MVTTEANKTTKEQAFFAEEASKQIDDQDNIHIHGNETAFNSQLEANTELLRNNDRDETEVFEISFSDGISFLFHMT